MVRTHVDFDGAVQSTQGHLEVCRVKQDEKSATVQMGKTLHEPMRVWRP